MLKGNMMLILVMLKEIVMIEFDHDICVVINLKICLFFCVICLSREKNFHL